MQKLRCVHNWKYLKEAWKNPDKTCQVRVYKICKMCGKKVRIE